MTRPEAGSPVLPVNADGSEVLGRSLGLADEAFQQRRPLRGQITKREVRAVTLYSLGLRADSVVWDIGAGTGSVSVEAALIAYRGSAYAIERDESSTELLRDNVDRWGSSNVRIVIGEAPSVLADLPDPDSVFVGGSGGQLTEILDTVCHRLKPGGRIVVNLAVLERTNQVYQHFKGLGFVPEITMINAARGRELRDGTVRLEAMNPVFIIVASRGEFSDE